MRVLLVSIQEYTEYREEIGIELIASCLEKANVSVNVIAVCKDNYNELENSIDEYNPDIVGFNSYITTYDFLIKIIDYTKLLKNNVVICVGGYMATYYPLEILSECKSIDYLTLYAGETAWVELVNSLENGRGIEKIDGIAFRSKGNICINDKAKPIINIENEPFPSRVMIEKYNIKYATISGSRGCEKHCTFCCSNEFWKWDNLSWRGKCLERVIEEIQLLISKYGIRTFFIQDNSFEDGMDNADKLMLFALLLLENKIDISYHINIRAELCRCLTSDKIHLLKKSGLSSVFIGMESSNADDLKKYGKTASREDNLYALEILRENNVVTDIGFINFNPFSSINKLNENLDFLQKYGKCVDLYLLTSTLMIFRGTAFYRMVKKSGLMLDNMHFSNPFNYKFKNPEIEALKDYVRDTYASLLKECNYKRILTYSLNYKCVLENLYRKCSDDLKEKVLDVYRQNDELLSVVNNMNAGWFRKLIYVAEGGNVLSFDDVTEKMYDKTLLHETILQLESNNKVLLKNILKCEPDKMGVLRKYF